MPPIFTLARRALFLMLALAAGLAHAAVPQAERDWLMAIYNQTDGANWSNNANWDTGDPCTNSWHGITCASGEITKLDLHSNFLRGTVPAMPHGTGIFEKLELIDFSETGNSRLTAVMPELRDLPALKTVRLHNTKDGANPGIQSTLPTLTNVPLLEEYTAYASSFTGTIPALAGLTHLVTFNARNNQLTGSIPDLSSLSALVTFNVSDNLLNGTINSPTLPAALEDFKISNNQLTGSPPLATAKLRAAGSSKLCANHLENTLDANENDDWNHATPATTHWYDNCTYVITPNPGPHGVLTPANVAEHAYGAQVVLTAGPDAYYLLDTLTSNCPGGMQSGDDYMLNAQKNCTVTATFKRDPAAPQFTVTATAGTGGSITPNGATQVYINDPLQFTLAPAQGYMVHQVTGTCGGTRNGNTFTTNSITANCTVVASFALIPVPEHEPEPDPTTGPITVPPGGTGRLTGPGSAMLGTSSTLTVQPAAACSPITPPTSGSATVVLGALGARVRISGTGRAVVLAGANGPVLGLLEGSLTVASDTAGQPLLDVGSASAAPACTASGRQVLAGEQGASVQFAKLADGTTAQPLAHSASVPCGHLCTTQRIALLADELAHIDTSGLAQRIAVQVPTSTVTTPVGWLSTPVSQLAAATPLRTPGTSLLAQAQAALHDLLELPLSSRGQSPSGNVTWALPDGLVLGALPLGQPQVDTTVPAGASLAADGTLRIVSNGLVQNYAPAPWSVAAAMEALPALVGTYKLTLTVNPAGAWVVQGEGRAPLVLRPGWAGQQGSVQGERARFEEFDGQLWLLQPGGLSLPVYPAIAEPEALAQLLRGLDANVQLQVGLDGAALVRFAGQDYRVTPRAQLEPVPASHANDAFWLTLEGGTPVLRMRLTDGWVQAMEVE